MNVCGNVLASWPTVTNIRRNKKYKMGNKINQNKKLILNKAWHKRQSNNGNSQSATTAVVLR